MWLKFSAYQVFVLFTTFLSLNSKEGFAQTIEVASIDHSSFDVNSTDFSTVITKDANNRPAIIFHTETRDVLKIKTFLHVLVV